MGAIKAIFYARFHSVKGSHILHQVPEDAITADAQPATFTASNGQHETQQQQSLFNFTQISSLVIPSQEFCDRLITVCVNKHRVISHPVCLENSKYERNQFIFNFGLVLEDGVEDWSGYGNVVGKVASLFRNLEEQGGWLSSEERRGGKSQVYSLCEMMFEDLNHYTECMIPIDSSNTLNLKIFPTRPSPPPVFPWHVPLSTVALSTLTQASMTDLTLSRIIPHIDGIASVAHIAEQADVDISLARKAIAHLLYYNCVLLLDIFSFSAQYAVTPELSTFVGDAESQEEALGYVTVGQYRKLTDSERLAESRLTDSGTVGGGSRPPESHRYHGSASEVWGWKTGESGLSRAQLVEMYASFKPGLSLRSWCIERNALLSGLDVRRLITFGVIKGFLYRCHRYAVLDDGPSLDETEAWKSRMIRRRIMSRKARNGDAGDKALLEVEATVRRLSRPGSIASALRESVAGTVNGKNRPVGGDENGEELEEEIPIIYYMDGQHCFDEICTDLCVSEARAMEKMKEAYNTVTFITR